MRKMEHIYQMGIYCSRSTSVERYCEKIYKTFANGIHGFYVVPETEDHSQCKVYYYGKCLLTFEWKCEYKYATHGYGVDSAVILRDMDKVLIFDEPFEYGTPPAEYGELCRWMKQDMKRAELVSADASDAVNVLLGTFKAWLEKEAAELKEKERSYYNAIQSRGQDTGILEWTFMRRKNYNPAVSSVSFKMLEEVREELQYIQEPLKVLEKILVGEQKEVEEIPESMIVGTPEETVLAIYKEIKEFRKKREEHRAAISEIVSGYKKKNIEPLMEKFEDEMGEVNINSELISLYARYVVMLIEKMSDEETILVDGENMNMKRYCFSLIRD